MSDQLADRYAEFAEILSTVGDDAIKALRAKIDRYQNLLSVLLSMRGKSPPVPEVPQPPEVGEPDVVISNPRSGMTVEQLIIECLTATPVVDKYAITKYVTAREDVKEDTVAFALARMKIAGKIMDRGKVKPKGYGYRAVYQYSLPQKQEETECPRLSAV